LIEDTLKAAENWLAQNQTTDFREVLLQLYFRLHVFLRTAEFYDASYRTIVESQDGVKLRLFCLDPASRIRAACEPAQATVFFSGTLSPMDYYRALLGGEETDRQLQLPSPFPPENLVVLVNDKIRTDLKNRVATLAEIVNGIRELVAGRQGNYLVYFPSYQYLNVALDQFREAHPEIAIIEQRPRMSEAEREEFLAAFAADHNKTLVGFAVLGGIFGEGIDLTGERLIGAVIVGVGLPQLCVERDLICDYFQERTGAGFEYAYTFPGMNRVLQAAGRVIRSETDRGTVLLIDRRFAEARYNQLFPKHWALRSFELRT
jgi:DNA excision repair protein ERCC-2